MTADRNPDDELVRASKLMSWVLRHRPEAAGLSLNEGGWVAVDDVLSGLASRGDAITREMLDEVVRTNSKRRFALSADGSMIRANQGHSAKLDVDLGLRRATPPAVLFHGTKEGSLASIRKKGLLPMGRQHVHLSRDRETATLVGDRRSGSTVILTVDAAAMHRDRRAFLLSENGVWLIDAVPPGYLGFPEPEPSPRGSTARR